MNMRDVPVAGKMFFAGAANAVARRPIRHDRRGEAIRMPQGRHSGWLRDALRRGIEN